MNDIEELYQTSDDYELLADLMEKFPVVCIVSYHGCKEVASTAFLTFGKYPSEWRIKFKGFTYIWARDRKRFINECRKRKVRFIPPTKEVSSNREVTP